MENYENKELLKEAAKQSLESLKDLKPGTDEYTNTAKMALQLYDMQLKSDEQESNQNLKEDEERRKGQEVINDQEKARRHGALSGQSLASAADVSWNDWYDGILVDLRGWRCSAAFQSNERWSP